MKLELEDQAFAGMVADRLADRILAHEGFIERIADAIALRFELLDRETAAALLGVVARTLTDNHKQWGLDKSLAYGEANGRFFLSQIIDRAHAKVIEGKRSGTEAEKAFLNPSFVRRLAAELAKHFGATPAPQLVARMEGSNAA